MNQLIRSYLSTRQTTLTLSEDMIGGVNVKHSLSFFRNYNKMLAYDTNN